LKVLQQKVPALWLLSHCFHELAARSSQVFAAVFAGLLRHGAGHLSFEPPDHCDTGKKHCTNRQNRLKWRKPRQHRGVSEYQKRALIADGAAYSEPCKKAAEHADFSAAFLSG